MKAGMDKLPPGVKMVLNSGQYSYRPFPLGSMNNTDR